VEYLKTKDAQQLAVETLDSPPLKRLGTDARFEALMETLRDSASGPKPTEVIANARGEPVVRLTRSGRGLRVWVDGRFGDGFGEYLIRSLPDLMHRFDTEADQVRGQ
jgi:hypothetical protein